MDNERAKEILETLGKEDHLYAHHGNVFARPESAYARLVELVSADAPKGLNALRDAAHKTATEHGFKDASIGEDIALMHSELSEALEDHRAGKLPHEMTYDVVITYPREPYQTSGRQEARTGVTESNLRVLREMPGVSISAKPCGIPSELADVVIRILHFSGKHGVDIERAVREKMAFNDSRPYKHGGKKL